MPLTVHAFGAYASYDLEDTPWRPKDFDVYKLVKALKGEPFRGYAKMRHVNGRWLEFTQQRPENAWSIFAGWAAQRLSQLDLGPVILVPVPSSKTIQFEQDTTPLRMARAIQSLSGHNCHVEPWLKFRHEMPSAHDEGGTRNQAIIQAALDVSHNARAGRIVLIDDVKTSGGHLKACAQVLRSVGATVDIALVAGLTVWEQIQDPLDVPPVDIEQIVTL